MNKAVTFLMFCHLHCVGIWMIFLIQINLRIDIWMKKDCFHFSMSEC